MRQSRMRLTGAPADRVNVPTAAVRGTAMVSTRIVNPVRGRHATATRPFTEASQPDLFYNYYVPNNQGAAAAAYPAPFRRPV